MPGKLADAMAQPAPQPVSSRAIYDPEQEGTVDVPLYLRTGLTPGMQVAGPAVIAEDETSTYLTAAFDARVAANGYLILERNAGPSE